MTNADTLLQSVERLFALLDERQVKYVLVNGLALLTYVEGRNTQDIDLIMALPALERLPEIHIADREPNFEHGEFEGLQIDILLTRNPLFAEIPRKYTTRQRFLEREIPTTTIEGLLLLKLYALPSLYRHGNFAKVGLYENDIATLMHYYQPAIAPLWETLAQHLSESDLAELREIVAEIEERLRRFQKSTKEGIG